MSDQQVHEYFSHFYEFVMHDEVVTITPQWSTDAVSRYFDPTGPYGPVIKAANLPASFVIIQRINLGLMAILGDLRATGQLPPHRGGAVALGRRPARDADGRGRGRLAGVPLALTGVPTMRRVASRPARTLTDLLAERRPRHRSATDDGREPVRPDRGDERWTTSPRCSTTPPGGRRGRRVDGRRAAAARQGRPSGGCCAAPGGRSPPPTAG